MTDMFEDLLESKKEEEKLFDFSYSTLYRLTSRIEGGGWWPHRLRAERAYERS